MADYEGRYEGNGGAYHENGGGSASPPPRSGGFDDLGGSRSQYGSHECGRGSSSNSRGYERGSSKSRGYERGSSKSREMEKEKERDRDWDRGRDRERDRKHDHHHKDHRGRSERRGSDWGTSVDHDHHRSRSHIRHRDSDGDGDRDVHRRHSSRSFSESRSHRRPRSRSRSRSKSKRTSGFDLAPPGNVLEPVAASGTGSGMTGATPTFPGMFPNLIQVTNPLMSVLYPGSQQATRHARRVYVGGLSPTANEQSVAAFFSQAMSAIGGNSGGPGDTVVNVYINHEKKFAFVEMRNADEASNAMALDGIIFEGAPVKVRRPSDYNANQAAYLGRSQPDPNLNLAAVGLSPGSAGGLLEGPDRIFVGGLPYYFTEAQIRELLESFGPLRGFDLVKDRETGNSKGYAFCVYQDLSVTDIACAALNGIKMGDKTLTVRRANQGAVQPRPEQESILDHVRQQVAFQKLVYHSGPLPTGPLPTKVVCLTQAVSVDELKDDEEYGDIMEDMREEGGRYGKLVNVVIPRPGPNGEPAPGVGKVFLEFADTEGSSNARQRLDGRKFGGREVSAIFYPEDKFAQGEYES